MESNKLFSLEEKWEAIVTCDHSFDGKFFYAVKTTGIFCRPSCKSKTPHYKNICFFNHAREAVQQGFRPCKRCRPELLIDSYDPQQEILEKTKLFLEKNYEEKITLDTIAVIIGVSPYHLSRTFKEHTGTSPHEYLEQLRIQKAKNLLMNTDHNVTEICFQIGYKNLSSFYKHFKKSCGCSPHQFRLNQKKSKPPV